MFLELQDKNYYIAIRCDLKRASSYVFNMLGVFVVEVFNKNLFNWKDVEDEFLRAKEYLEQNSWKLEEISIEYIEPSTTWAVEYKKGVEKFSGYNLEHFILFANDFVVGERSGIYKISFSFKLLS